MIDVNVPELIPLGVKAVAEEDVKRLFVYGSLMEGFFNYKKSLEGKVISRIPARVRGLLYHQNRKGYPAMVGGKGWVRGEFLELKDFETLISLCDTIEKYYSPGNPENEYERKASQVELESGGEVLAHVYWYARNDLGSPGNPAFLIASGDWREYMNKQELQ